MDVVSKKEIVRHGGGVDIKRKHKSKSKAVVTFDIPISASFSLFGHQSEFVLKELSRSLGGILRNEYNLAVLDTHIETDSISFSVSHRCFNFVKNRIRDIDISTVYGLVLLSRSPLSFVLRKGNEVIKHDMLFMSIENSRRAIVERAEVIKTNISLLEFDHFSCYNIISPYIGSICEEFLMDKIYSGSNLAVYRSNSFIVDPNDAVVRILQGLLPMVNFGGSWQSLPYDITSKRCAEIITQSFPHHEFSILSDLSVYCEVCCAEDGIELSVRLGEGNIDLNATYTPIREYKPGNNKWAQYLSSK